MNCVYQKSLDFWAVLMNTWYATKEMVLQIEKIGKIYYCPLKDNIIILSFVFAFCFYPMT